MRKKIGKLTHSFFGFIKNNRVLLMTLVYVAVIVDALFLEIKSDIITFGIIGVYVYFIRAYALKSKATFLFCLFLLMTMYILFLLYGPQLHTEKTAVWLVLFMLIGIIQQWRE